MKLIAFQATPTLQREGLPYWIFWLLLFAILLFLLFIFLRNRSLRLRLSTFLAGARRRSLLIQLRFQLKRQRQKKVALLKKLGALGWDRDLHPEGSDAIRGSLRELFEKRSAAQLEWKNALTELERIRKRLEEAVAVHEKKVRELNLQKQPLQELLKRKREEERNLKKQTGARDLERQVAEGRSEIEAIRAQLGESERGLREVEAEAKDQRREMEKEIHFWRKKKKKTQELIKEIEARQEEFFHSFGEMLEERRPESPGLAEAYREIDLVNQRLDTLQHRLETLSGG